MADEKARFEQMLVAINGGDNVIRKQAEEAYNQAKTSNPAWVVQALTEVGCTSADPAAANTAMVLLRKLYGAKETAFESCDAATQAQLKHRLLVLFADTTKPTLVRRATAAAVANLAVKLSSGGKNAWPELWENLLKTIQNPTANDDLRASSVFVFAQVATYLTTTYFKDHLGTLATAFSQCLMSGSTDLKKNTAEAIANMVAILGDDKMIAAMRPTLEPLLKAVEATCASGDDDIATEILKNMLVIAEQTPEYFKGQVPKLLQSMMVVARSSNVDAKCRHSALEIVLEYGAQMPKSIRKVKGFATEFFNLMFQYLQNPPMEDNWATTYDDSDEAGDSDFEAGATSMDRLARIVEGKGMQEIATSVIMANVGHSDWRARTAALTTLTYLFEGCKEQFMSQLGGIFESVVKPRLDDENAYVRYCAIQCVAQMCRDFAPDFQKHYAQAVLPLVCGKMADPVPRIQALSAATLHTFLQDLDDDDEDDDDDDDDSPTMKPCRYEWMIPYITPLVQSLEHTMKAAPLLFITEQCFLTMSTLISLSGREIVPHTATLVALCQTVLAMADSTDEIKKLKSRAIECVTLLASIVGKENFAPWGQQVCQFLNQILEGGLSADDARLRYVLRGWTCMVECLKEDTVPYMPVLMPKLLAVANIECDAEEIETDAGDNADEAAKPADDKIRIVKICTPGVGEKTVRLNTGLIEDKDLAITIIMSVTRVLKGHMKPWLSEITQTAVKLLSFQAYEEIRETAAMTISGCARSYAEAEPAQLPAFTEYVLQPLLDAAKDETEVQVCNACIDAFGDVLEAAPKGILSTDKMTLAAKILYEIFEESTSRLDTLVQVQQEKAAKELAKKSKMRHAAESDSDEEDDDVDDAKDNEEWMLSTVVDAVGKLVKTTPQFVPLFVTSFLPMCESLLGPTRNSHHHKFGLCILADFVEHGQQLCVPHIPSIMAAFGHFAATATEVGVKQAAIYGGGVLVCVMATHLPQPSAEGAQFAVQLSQAIGTYLTTPTATEDEWLSCTDNSVGALLKAYEAFPAAVDGAAVMQVVIPHLPLKDDQTEAEAVHEKLVDWLARGNHPLLQGANRSAVVAALGQTTWINAATKAKMAAMMAS